MDKKTILKQADRILKTAKGNPYGSLAETKEFLKICVGVDNQFLVSLNFIDSKTGASHVSHIVSAILESFKGYVENDLLRSLTLVREIQIDVMSAYLLQAEKLLKDDNVHLASVIILVGSSLEEFLRIWLEAKMNISTIEPSVESYAKELKTLDLINKQDLKDISSWEESRTEAVHGRWEKVENRERVKLHLEGVNLFIRKYS